MISKRKTQIRYYHVESMGALRRLRRWKKTLQDLERCEKKKSSLMQSSFLHKNRLCHEVSMWRISVLRHMDRSMQ